MTVGLCFMVWLSDLRKLIFLPNSDVHETVTFEENKKKKNENLSSKGKACNYDFV